VAEIKIKIMSKIRIKITLALFGLLLLVGCGTTRSTDTLRTATEQLLISDAIDQSVQVVDFSTLSGETVFLDDSYLDGSVDRGYLISSLRQHLLASGCLLQGEREKADYIVEARAGAIGTDRNDLLFGIPAMNVPQFFPMPGVPSAIPEVPLAKRRDQRGIAKIGVFAYHRETGTPVWQSGLAQQESSSNDVWILGAGPFEHGTISEGTRFAGKKLLNNSVEKSRERPSRSPSKISLTQGATFTSPARLAKKEPAGKERKQETQLAKRLPETLPEIDTKVEQANHQEDSAASPMLPMQELFPRALMMPDKHSKNGLSNGLNVRIFNSQLLPGSSSSTATIAGPQGGPPANDLIPLPQPRFD